MRKISEVAFYTVTYLALIAFGIFYCCTDSVGYANYVLWRFVGVTMLFVGLFWIGMIWSSGYLNAIAGLGMCVYAFFVLQNTADTATFRDSYEVLFITLMLPFSIVYGVMTFLDYKKWYVKLGWALSAVCFLAVGIVSSFVPLEKVWIALMYFGCLLPVGYTYSWQIRDQDERNQRKTWVK